MNKVKYIVTDPCYLLCAHPDMAKREKVWNTVADALGYLDNIRMWGKQNGKEYIYAMYKKALNELPNAKVKDLPLLSNVRDSGFDKVGEYLASEFKLPWMKLSDTDGGDWINKLVVEDKGLYNANKILNKSFCADAGLVCVFPDNNVLLTCLKRTYKGKQGLYAVFTGSDDITVNFDRSQENGLVVRILDNYTKAVIRSLTPEEMLDGE